MGTTDYIKALEDLVGSIQIVPCPRHCISGHIGMDNCNTCGVTGSGFRMFSRFFPNTEEGWKEAYEQASRLRLWKHVERGGVYAVISRDASIQCSTFPNLEHEFKNESWTLYRDIRTDKCYIRLKEEFEDGRFVKVISPQKAMV